MDRPSFVTDEILRYMGLNRKESDMWFHMVRKNRDFLLTQDQIKEAIEYWKSTKSKRDRHG